MYTVEDKGGTEQLQQSIICANRRVFQSLFGVSYCHVFDRHGTPKRRIMDNFGNPNYSHFWALGRTLMEGVRLIPLLTGVTSLTTSLVSEVVPCDVIDSEVTPVGLLRV